MHLTENTYAKLVQIILSATGIQLGDNRHQMLRNRIAGRVRQLGLSSFEEYLRIIELGRAEEELRTLIDSVTTNYTGFFRDHAQFEHLSDVLERLYKTPRKKIRIWSAACSTGEEVYSLAITASLVADRCKADIDRVRILGTDISQKVLCHAFRGIYPADRIASLPQDYRRFFLSYRDGDTEPNEPHVRVDNELRGITIFRRINLCDPSLNVPGDIDVIFVRNVLIYFDSVKIKQILSSCVGRLNGGGYLYVGASESVGEYLPRLDVVRPCVFRLKQQTSASEIITGLTSTLATGHVHA